MRFIKKPTENKLEIMSIPVICILLFYLTYPFQDISIGVNFLKLYYLAFIITALWASLTMS